MAQIILSLDTCACKIDITSRNKNDYRLIEKCRTHDTVTQALLHNNTLNLANESEDKIISNKQKERQKPQFQRR